MPVSPANRKYYGYRWRTKIRPRIVDRAGGCCERCKRCPRRLEVAHLDRNPANGDDENLAALCPACHRRWDYAAWARTCHETRAARKDAARPLLELAG